MLRTSPFLQDNSHVQLLSIQLFSKVMELQVEEGGNPLTTIVSQSLLPLFLGWHHENVHVAEVRFGVMLPHPWEGARPPPAPVPRGLQPPLALAQGAGSRVTPLRSGATCGSLLLCRPLAKPCFVPHAS